MMSFIERYQEKISGRLSCVDRVVIQGTLPGLCYPEGMTAYLNAAGIRIFDYPRFAEPLRDQIRDTAERLALENGLHIYFVRKAKPRKEAFVKKILEARGDPPGLVCILSVMESCPSDKPWDDKMNHRAYLKPSPGKCLHYYFYFIDEDYGLCYCRVPTGCPFRLQVYFNGHNWLAAKLKKARIGYRLLDNAFLQIDDWQRTQQLADDFSITMLHRALDRFALRDCPVIKKRGLAYHFSLMQVEYATDIAFLRQRDLAP